MRQQTSLTGDRLRQELAHIRQAGYGVDYKPGRGYRLTSVPDRLVPDEIQMGLGTRIIGRDILTYEEVDSTMGLAEGLAEKGAREGTTIFAEKQRSGHGRSGRRWHCPKNKGILVTTILRPQINADRMCLLTGMIAVAVADTIRDHLKLPALIKWPNDVTVNEKKVCGILVEASTPSGKKPYFLAGIGLNVNIARSVLPKDVNHPPTSLSIEKGSRIDRIALSRALLGQLDRWYAPFKDSEYKDVRRRWAELFPLTGRRVRIREKDSVHTGKVVALSAQGGLTLILNGGTRKSFRGEYLTIEKTLS
ncbi:MAG: biotin--[acetyl-CoA-carboxylase] ligase [Planctomycetota bacterium]